MSKLTSIYVWLFIGAIFIAANIWVLSGFGSRSLFAAGGSDPVQLQETLNQALELSKNLKGKSTKSDLELIGMVRDPFTPNVLPTVSGFSKYSKEKKFSKTSPVALQLPHIDGILTIKKLDGTEFKYLLIKGKLIRVGDSINGFRVVGVSPNSVLVKAKGKEFKVAFSQSRYDVMARKVINEESILEGEEAMEKQKEEIASSLRSSQ